MAKVDPEDLNDFATAMGQLKDHPVVAHTPVGGQIKPHLEAIEKIARTEYDRVKEKNAQPPTAVTP